MNYYQDLTNNYSMNRNSNYYYNDYYDDSNNHFNNYNHNNYNENSCCVRRVEETFCCFPSYYNEDRKYDKNEDLKDKCFEGTFKICPKHHNCNKENKNDCDQKKYSNKCNCNCFNRCCCPVNFKRW